MPALADQGLYIGSESSFYRVLHAHSQVHRRARARPPQEPRAIPRLTAIAPNQLRSWDITYLPTTVRGIWLCLGLVIELWSRKVVAWDVAEEEDPAIAGGLASRACLRERISKGRKQPLILHADNGNAMRAATLESRPVVFSYLAREHAYPTTTRTRNRCATQSDTGLTTPAGHSSAKTTCAWVASFIDWYNHRHHRSAIKFVPPQQRHSGASTTIGQQRAKVYEKARRANPTRWSRHTRCWRQPAEVWINKPAEESNPILELPLIQAASMAAEE